MEEIECTICNTIDYKPLILTCSHGICEKCESILPSKVCPMCLQPYDKVIYNRQLHDVIIKMQRKENITVKKEIEPIKNISVQNEEIIAKKEEKSLIDEELSPVMYDIRIIHDLSILIQSQPIKPFKWVDYQKSTRYKEYIKKLTGDEYIFAYQIKGDKLIRFYTIEPEDNPSINSSFILCKSSLGYSIIEGTIQRIIKQGLTMIMKK